MNGKMLTIMRLTLILFSFHPEPGTSQSQKSQIWRIPVVPNNDADNNNETEEIISPSPQRSQRFDELTDPFESQFSSPSDRQAAEESLRSSQLTSELLRELGVQSTGQETNKWLGGGRLSLRGSQASEPAVSVDGVLLSSGFTGSHAEEFIPTAAIGGVRVYPFFPTAGLPYSGISGGYDFQLLSGPQKELQAVNVQIESPLALAAGARIAVACSQQSCLQIAWGSGFFNGSQRVFDDGNTPQIDSDDTFTELLFNDVKRVSTAATYRRDFGNGSLLKTSFLTGGESRGISGLPLASASAWNRLSRRFALFTQSVESLSPVSGVNLLLKIGMRWEDARFLQDLHNGSAQIKSDERKEDFKYISGYVSVPLFSSQLKHLAYLRAQAERSRLSGKVELTKRPETLREPSDGAAFAPTLLSGELLRGSLGLGITAETSKGQTLKSEFSLHGSDFHVRRDCGVFAPAVLCADESNQASPDSLASLLDWRIPLGADFLFFTQAGRLARTPTPLEITGRPDGILGNPRLQPELANAFELGFLSRWGKLSLFAVRDINLITPEQVSPFLLRFENTAETQRVGLSGEVEMRVHDNEIQADFEIIDLRVRRGRLAQKVVPFAPSERFNVSFARNFSASLFSANVLQFLKFAVQVEQTGSFWIDSQGTVRVTPPALVSLRVSSPLQTSAGVLLTTLSASNLFDERFSRLSLPAQTVRRVGWSQTPVLPVQGRTLEFSLSLLSSAGPE